MTEPQPYPHCDPACRFIKEGECRYREMHIPTIAVDFDKVLFTHESWQGHYHVGEPISGAKETLLALQEMGFKIMIWTTRAQVDIIADACSKNGIPYDYINQNPNQPPEINPSKPVADYYIDDRAVTFTTWSEVLDEIKHREKHDPYYRVNNHTSAGSEAVLDRLVEMIDAHAENWDELCELQEFIRELRQKKEREQG